MKRKTALTWIISSILLVSLVAGMQVVEVAEANPYSFFYQRVDPIPGSVAPQITMFNPQDNNTYNSNTITVSFNISKPITPKGDFDIMYLDYRLDNDSKQLTIEFSDWLKDGNNNTYTPLQQFSFSQDFNLSEGNHSLTVYSQTAFLPGSMTVFYLDSSASVSFMVDITSPNISNLSLENKTYTSNIIPLDFNVNETSWLRYSLDNQDNITISGNATLTGLSDGSHSLVVYANDTAGNAGESDTVFFTVDTTPPNISDLSTENNTYSTTDIPLSFNTNESTSWLAYSIDNQANVTIDGNLTLNVLSEGTHSIVVFANDTAGNMGKSDTVLFTINTQPIPTSDNFKVENFTPIIIILSLVGAVVVVASLVYFAKHKGWK